jgi:two-component system response regulator MtrA
LGARKLMTLVLVVDDDQDLAEMLGIVLTGAGIDVDLVSRGDEALEVFRNNPPDLVLLDVMLPGLDGIEVCRQIRAESMVPIVMLSAKGDTHDVVRGLEAGADDYMVKPFRHQSELVARIRTRLRRTNTDVAGLLSIADLLIDVNAHEVTRSGKGIALTRLEFDLLVALARDPGRVFTRDALLSEVWGYRHSTDTRLVNVHVQRLRAKIEHDPEHPEIVLTVRGVGYKAGNQSK